MIFLAHELFSMEEAFCSLPEGQEEVLSSTYIFLELQTLDLPSRSRGKITRWQRNPKRPLTRAKTHHLKQHQGHHHHFIGSSGKSSSLLLALFGGTFLGLFWKRQGPNHQLETTRDDTRVLYSVVGFNIS